MGRESLSVFKNTPRIFLLFLCGSIQRVLTQSLPRLVAE
jgi:hypothetical protein